MSFTYTPRTSLMLMDTKSIITKNGASANSAAAKLLLQKKQNSRTSPTLLQELKGAGSRAGESMIQTKSTKSTPISEQESALPPSSRTTPLEVIPGTMGAPAGSFGEFQEAPLEVNRPKENDKKTDNKKTIVIVLVVVAVVVIGFLIWKKPWKKTA